MNATYLRIDLARQLRDVGNIAFVVALPVALYLVFGSAFSDGSDAGNGNVQLYVMVSMALYGASVATTAVSGTAAVELMQGWGRQLGLTPMGPPAYVATKLVVALVVAAGAVVAVFAAGLLTGAQASTPGVWVASGVIAWAVSGTFSLYGLAVAQTFRSESAVSVASAGLVLLAFFGNLFVPLTGTILAVARFTPMYGCAGLARWPQLRGRLVDPADGHGDPLWVLVVNVLAWAAVFGLVATWAVRRGRRRQ